MEEEVRGRAGAERGWGWTQEVDECKNAEKHRKLWIWLTTTEDVTVNRSFSI